MPQHQNNNEVSFSKEKKQGIAISAIVHLMLAIFLLSFSFKIKPSMPVEVEEGLLVNFGYDQTGSGLFEPAPQAQYVPPPVSSGEEGEDDAILTQDFEESVEVKKKEPDPEQVKRETEAREAERKRLEEARAERARIEQENAEKRRIEEEQRRLNQINDRAKNAFGNAGNAGETGTSEGVAGGEGNQGVQTGTVGAPNYGPGGGIGDGSVSFRLGDRNYRSLPKPNYIYQKEGTVVVEIAVDRSGKVTNAVAGVKGSTTLDEDLIREARQAAMKATFESNDNAPMLQKGTITYVFKLN